MLALDLQVVERQLALLLLHLILSRSLFELGECHVHHRVDVLVLAARD